MAQRRGRRGPRGAAGGEVAAAAVSTAARLLLRGIDPAPYLRSDDPVEHAVINQALTRAESWHQQEQQDHARQIRNEIAQMLSGKKGGS